MRREWRSLMERERRDEGGLMRGGLDERGGVMRGAWRGGVGLMEREWREVWVWLKMGRMGKKCCGPKFCNNEKVRS